MIQVENLAKCYRIKKGTRQDTAHAYSTLRDDIASGFRNLLSGNVGSKSDKFEDFWALRDVSFDVK